MLLPHPTVIEVTGNGSGQRVMYSCAALINPRQKGADVARGRRMTRGCKHAYAQHVTKIKLREQNRVTGTHPTLVVLQTRQCTAANKNQWRLGRVELHFAGQVWKIVCMPAVQVQPTKS